mmetsp:Transcript_26721/g.42194  ORF Transcript_26721/g.42194 Transcript_26721/m.42194 type:complete len:151 (-) Transcript_26721:1-453(-)
MKEDTTSSSSSSSSTTTNSPPLTAETTAIRSSSDRNLRVPCYCEENSWRIAHRHLHNNSTTDDDNSNGSSSTARHNTNKINNNNNLNNAEQWDEYNVVFVSNALRCCPFFRQRATPRDEPREYVCWDYHVFVIRSSRRSSSSSSSGSRAN